VPKIIGMEDGSFEATIDLEKRGNLTVRHKRFRNTYIILGDDTSQSEEAIILTSGLPPLFYPLRGAYCKEQRPKEISTIRHPVTGVAAILWEVACDFDSSVDPDQNQPPEAQEPDVSWGGEVGEELLEKDAVTGDPIQTDAEEPILLMTPVVFPILKIERYELWPFDPDTMLDYTQHTNSATFWGAPPGCALMLPMETSTKQIIEETAYVRVTYQIKFKMKKEAGVFKEDTWKARVLHHGFKYRPKPGPPVIYQDRHGNPATVNLTVGGFKLPDGNTPEYKEFNRLYKANFNNLSLGPF